MSQSHHPSSYSSPRYRKHWKNFAWCLHFHGARTTSGGSSGLGEERSPTQATLLVHGPRLLCSGVCVLITRCSSVTAENQCYEEAGFILQRNKVAQRGQVICLRPHSERAAKPMSRLLGDKCREAPHSGGSQLLTAPFDPVPE
ncbi:hypothetical protein H1C71_028943 [Ictidomys tridecemlineatus]|nr:hypothetical protein H1C71_028943 [Ictidomys tridecemlineatus]